jgi:very-short-patch-repair endonuclease/protein-arginine kinase activator protein McsA
VIIICKHHGEFLQVPSSHLQGTGCGTCAENQLLSTEQFIERSKLIHGDTYDYNKVVYKSTHEKVIIVCKKHGEFLQLPSNHLKGRGCNECGTSRTANLQRSNKEDFICRSKLKHGDTYDYSHVDYVTARNKVKILCLIHGEFQQSPDSHIKGIGCRKCGTELTSSKLRSNTYEFIEKARLKHGDMYDYSNVEYVIALKNVIIICKKHGEFLQTPSQHLTGSGCPLCFNKTEGKLYETLKTVYPSIVTQYKQDWCKNITYLPYDFCIPELNIIIELDGGQHFKDVKIWRTTREDQFKNDQYKEQCANANNYSVIRLLQEDVFYDRYDWCKELCDAIEDIKRSDDIVNIYLCKHNEYADF